MVSADSLNFDVLGLIFSFLSGNDLVSVALVNRAFLNGVTARLYHSLVFTHTQAKKYPKIVSPFASLLDRPSLGIYVHVCDITAFPLYKGQPNQEFLSQCIRALDLCPNLSRFRLAPNMLPSFLLTLARKGKLKELQANGSLTMEQAAMLVHVKGLRSIRIDHASWCLMNLFPRWVSFLGPTLTHLAFTLSSELNETILEAILILLPGLRGLLVRSCMKVDHAMVFRLISHTPLLESLSVTTWENPTTISTSYAGVSNLCHLHLDTRNTFIPASVETLWSGIIAHTKQSNAPLSSLTLQVSERLSLSSAIIEEITFAHADTLTSLRFIKCSTTLGGLQVLCRICERLERLALHIPMKELPDFTKIIAESSSLQVLVDELDPHSMHGPRASLKYDDVKALMTQCPKLRHIVCDGTRSWKGTGDAENLQITLERMKNSPFPSVMTFP